MDRLDFSMPGAYPSGFRMDADSRGGWFVLVPEPDRGAAKATAIRVARGSKYTVLPRESWPRDWPVRGIARIVARDGRLEIVAP